jgi:hypothetical protein
MKEWQQTKPEVVSNDPADNKETVRGLDSKLNRLSFEEKDETYLVTSWEDDENW